MALSGLGGLLWVLDSASFGESLMAGLMVLVRVVVQCCSRAPPSGPSDLTEKHCSSIAGDAAGEAVDE